MCNNKTFRNFKKVTTDLLWSELKDRKYIYWIFQWYMYVTNVTETQRLWHMKDYFLMSSEKLLVKAYLQLQLPGIYCNTIIMQINGISDSRPQCKRNCAICCGIETSVPHPLIISNLLHIKYQQYLSLPGSKGVHFFFNVWKT